MKKKLFTILLSGSDLNRTQCESSYWIKSKKITYLHTHGPIYSKNPFLGHLNLRSSDIILKRELNGPFVTLFTRDRPSWITLLTELTAQSLQRVKHNTRFLLMSANHCSASSIFPGLLCPQNNISVTMRLLLFGKNCSQRDIWDYFTWRFIVIQTYRDPGPSYPSKPSGPNEKFVTTNV